MRLPFRRGQRVVPSEVDRNPRNIDLPMGGFAPVRARRGRNTLVRWWWRNAARTIAGVGVILAVIGGALAATRPPPEVGLVGATLRAGGATLPSSGKNVWGGPGDAIYTLAQHPDGSMVGAASGSMGGHHFVATCTLMAALPTEIDEQCTFTVGSKQLTARDVLALDGRNRWHRTYSDGSTVTVGVPASGGVMPVAFPFGE